MDKSGEMYIPVILLINESKAQFCACKCFFFSVVSCILNCNSMIYALIVCNHVVLKTVLNFYAIIISIVCDLTHFANMPMQYYKPQLYSFTDENLRMKILYNHV